MAYFLSGSSFNIRGGKMWNITRFRPERRKEEKPVHVLAPNDIST